MNKRKKFLGHQKNSGKEIWSCSRECVVCGKKYDSHSNENGRKYCSETCQKFANGNLFTKCTECGKKIKARCFTSYWNQKCDACKKKRYRRHQRKIQKTGNRLAPDEIEFGDYKEPLVAFKGGTIADQKFSKGYGYKGVVAYSKDRDRVQCHLCGRLFRSITGSHTEKVHGITLDQYRELIGLASSTKLVGEGTREKLIKNYDRLVKKGFDGVRSGWREKNRLKTIERNKARRGQKISLETKNKRGSCPEQLLDKIRKLRNELGHTPSRKEFQFKHKGRFMGTIYATFGSWTKAVKMAGFKPQSQLKREKYSSEKLLEYLRMFYKEHGRTARSSDFRRGYLPDHKLYNKRFGGLNNARRIAGVPVLICIGAGRYMETMAEE